MTAQQQATVVFTIVATGNGQQKRGITYAGTQAGAGVAIAGIADHSYVVGDAVRVIQGPTAMAEAGAVIDGTETRLVTDAQGRFIPYTTGVVAARLRPGQTALIAGELVEVFPYTEQ